MSNKTPPEKLLPKYITEKIPALRTTEETPIKEIKVIAKFFTPDSNWTWYVFEGEQQEDEGWLFFGLVEGLETEMGYFTFFDLCEVRGPLGLPIERDRYYSQEQRQRDLKRLGIWYGTKVRNNLEVQVLSQKLSPEH